MRQPWMVRSDQEGEGVRCEPGFSRRNPVVNNARLID